VGLSSTAVAHGTKAHAEKPAQVSQSVATPVESQVSPEAEKAGPPSPIPIPSPIASPTQEIAPPASGESAHAGASFAIDSIVRDLTLSGFPTLHPLVVHVPVTFIPVAFVFALISLFTVRRALIWLTFGFALGGLCGGLLAAFPLHPHATGLSTAAKITLQKHDFFAYGTLWLGLLAVLLALVCLWKPRSLPKLFLSLLLLLATVSVSITAHYGGTLAYVHGVGVQGRYLSPH